MGDHPTPNATSASSSTLSHASTQVEDPNLSTLSAQMQSRKDSDNPEGFIERVESHVEDLATEGDYDLPSSLSPNTIPPATTTDVNPIPLRREGTRVSIQSEKPSSDILKSPPSRGLGLGRDKNKSGGMIQETPGEGDSVPMPPIERSTTSGSGKPYSAFSQPTKWLIVGLGGIAAMLSPISRFFTYTVPYSRISSHVLVQKDIPFTNETGSNIFVPAIPTLAIEFNKSTEEISLAVTIYLIFQAITPSFFGSMSDSFGRRPVYIGTLVCYMGANIGLALMPTSAYWLLLVLRALQV